MPRPSCRVFPLMPFSSSHALPFTALPMSRVPFRRFIRSVLAHEGSAVEISSLCSHTISALPSCRQGYVIRSVLCHTISALPSCFISSTAFPADLYCSSHHPALLIPSSCQATLLKPFGIRFYKNDGRKLMVDNVQVCFHT